MKTNEITSTTKSTSLKACACAIALTAALAAGAAMAATPATALANDGMPAYPAITQAGHYEGQQVTIGEDWSQPVYAEWHQDAAGQWWATFLTYNGATIYAQPAPAGCGWSFQAIGPDDTFHMVYRCEESATHGLYGKDGASSHWQDDLGNWY